MVGKQRLQAYALALAFLASTSRNASAGEGSRLRILAVTPDARHLAVAQDGEATWVCGLAKNPPAFRLPRADLEIEASCGGSHALLPFARWTFDRTTPETRALLPVTAVDGSKAAPARIAGDPDTRVAHLDILQQGVWYPVLVDEESTVTEASPAHRYASPELASPGHLSEIQGFVRANGSIVIVFSTDDTQHIDIVDNAIALSDSDIADAAGRFSRARDKARQRTQALREQYVARSGPFSEPKKNGKSRKRAQSSAAREAVKLWEQTRVFGPLARAEVADALWLLAWLEAPTRRQEALRFYLELRDRDLEGAAAIIRELSTDQATLAFATQLHTQQDPLLGLPAAHGCSVEHLDDSSLAGASDEQLLWIHRAQWAARGYRFSEPKVQTYFEGFVWYMPMPADAWRVRTTKKFRENPDAPLLVKTGASERGNICRENLEVILRAENTRKLSPPSL